ncbi:hypothetical protein LIER_26412 [Lithospermum erythrorhizon]|uniref:Retrotransposon gag domain-containing protein n=1 Tax=Lithospermum erythrorhizon TaxID=34254 RepID=A0AAV3RBG3_LITER
MAVPAPNAIGLHVDSPIQALDFIKDLETIFEPMEQELMQLNQGGRTIDEYAKRFNEPCRLLLDEHTSEKKKIERFHDGMILDIRSRLSLMTFSSFHELKNASLKDASSSSSAFRPVQFVRGELQGGRGGRIRGRGNQGLGVRSSQGNIGAGHGWMFTVIQEEAQNSPKVVTCTQSLFGRKVKVLFYSGATHSFLSTRFSHYIPIPR